ncbi:MAG: pur operon repressor [Firmicutes bacterium]|nr:pur operon repressor [Bacillota bacterium]MBQ2042431.1 pur operon repressor [Bacillota bacterium]
MKRAQRACFITQTLTEDPNRDYPLAFFAEKLGCAKSSVSEDLQIVRQSVEAAGLGYVETTAGARGGVRYVPYISKEVASPQLVKYGEMLAQPDRMIGSGFIYTTDLMSDPGFVTLSARVFARRFAAVEADMVVTVETKGIGVAMMTARLLNMPLVIIRREAKVSDGSTISINYFSGSADRIQKMSLSKRAIKPGSRAIIIDDFMRGGGSVKGMQDMLAEFDSKTVGVGVVIVAGKDEQKKIGSYFPIFLYDDAGSACRVSVNPELVV